MTGLMISEEECQVVKEVAVEISQKKEKTALAILLGEEDDDDDSRVFTMSEEFDKYLKETPLKSTENSLEWWSKIVTNFQF